MELMRLALALVPCLVALAESGGALQGPPATPPPNVTARRLQAPVACDSTDVNDFSSWAAMAAAGWSSNPPTPPDACPFCNPDNTNHPGSFRGWDANGPVLTLSMVLQGPGQLTLNYGCDHSIGTVEVLLDDVVIDTAVPGEESKFVSADFNDGSVLKIQELDTSIILIHSLALSCVDDGCGTLGWFPKPDTLSPCYPTLALMISQMNEPNVTITRDEGKDKTEDITFELKLGDLPLKAEYLEDDDLYYVVDMKVLDSQVSPQSDSQDEGCRDVWAATIANPTDLGNGYHRASITRSYTQLSEHCLLDAENAGDNMIEREGVIAIYVISTSNAPTTPTQGRTAGEYVERTWLRYVTVTFDVTTVDHLGIHIGDIDFSDRFNRSFHLGGFESSLALYESTSFTTTRANHSYEVGAAVHVEHTLDVSSPDLDLAVEAVYLSTEGNLHLPGNEAMVVHDMSDQLHEHDSGKSQALFTFIARRCENCFLHVVSKVVHQPPARRLSGRQLQEDGYTMQTLYAEMRPRPVEEFHGPLVQLSMVIRGVDYSALVSSFSLRTRIIAELAVPVVKRIGNGIAEENIMVTLSPGSVKADIVITVPAGADLAAIGATIEAPSFQSTLEDDVTRSLVAVEGIYSVAHGTISSDLTAVEVTKPEPLPERPEGATPSLGPLQVALIVAAVACTLSVLSCTLFLCRRARQAPQRKAGEGPKAVEGQPAGLAQEATPGTSLDAAAAQV